MQTKFFEAKEKHTFHLVDPSQLPFWISCSTMWFFHSIVSYLYPSRLIDGANIFLLLISTFLLLVTLFSWFRVTEKLRLTFGLCYNIVFNRLRNWIINSKLILNGCNKAKTHLIFGGPTIILVHNDKAPKGLLDAIYKFVSIWTFEQWFWSLLGLILLYIISTRLHNKYIAPRIGLYLNNLMTTYLISFDLIANFLLGIYCMYDRFSDLGQFMVQCPVAISPFIFIVEILIMTAIFVIRERAKKSASKPEDK